MVSGRRPSTVLATATRWSPRGWPMQIRDTAWGSVVIAGPATAVVDQNVMVGTAVTNPWGLPSAAIEPPALLARFTRYGQQVAQLAAGPFAVADLQQGDLVGALNAIIPVFRSHGRYSAIGNHPELVAELSEGGPPNRVPPGWSASVNGETAAASDIGVVEALPLVSLRGLDQEIEYHIRDTGFVDADLPLRSGARELAAKFPELRVHQIAGALVARPRVDALQTSQAPREELDAIRCMVSDLWWRAGLIGMTLFVPMFERPALDTLMLAIEEDRWLRTAFS